MVGLLFISPFTLSQSLDGVRKTLNFFSSMMITVRSCKVTVKQCLLTVMLTTVIHSTNLDEGLYLGPHE